MKFHKCSQHPLKCHPVLLSVAIVFGKRPVGGKATVCMIIPFPGWPQGLLDRNRTSPWANMRSVV